MDKATQEIAERVMHRLKFDAAHTQQTPIGRVRAKLGTDQQEVTLWIMRKERSVDHRVMRDITGAFRGTELINKVAPERYKDGIDVFRDAPIGRILADELGLHNYYTPQGNRAVESYNKASFSPYDIGGVDAHNVKIITTEGESRFNSLVEALTRIGVLQNEEEQLRQQLEIEQIEQRAKEIRERLASTRSEIANEMIALARFRNEEIKLRDQPVLDALQEDVKRSNLLDGGLIIAGAPGTGKTTSLIQRIAFLTSRTLTETLPSLTEDDKQLLFNSSQNWLFFSPNELLKMYLKDAMEKEELVSGERVEVWTTFRRKILRAYGWIGDADRSPFILAGEKGSLFPAGHKALAEIRGFFTERLIEIQQQKIKAALTIHLNEFEQERISRLRSSLELALRYTTLEQYVRLYVSLQRDFQGFTAQIRNSYQEQISQLSARTQAKIQFSDEVSGRVMAYLKEINEKQNIAEVTEESEEESEFDSSVQESDELGSALTNEQLSNQLNRMLQRLYRDLAWNKSPSELSKNLPGLWEIVQPFIDKESIKQISPASLYLKVYAPLTNGLEANFLVRFPAYYKRFRKEFLVGAVVEAKRDWFSQTVRERNKKLHSDEIDFLLWNLHQLFRIIFRISQDVYFKSANSFLSAFRQYTRAVIAIDEASDFSAVQLQAMASLSYPKFNCVTLCGDLMQRMTTEGVTTWDDFSQLWPDTSLKTLQKAYRQTPVLLTIARRMYTETIGEEPPFTSYAPLDTRYARPLYYQNEDLENTMDWVVQRIIDINRGLEGRFPTVAIFVENDVKVREVYEALHENEALNNVGLIVDACYNGRFLGERQAVRIFSVEYIKGMEFEAVFMLNVDDFESDLLNQYIYVGLTRANFYLALTARDGLPASLRYLQQEFSTESNWAK